MSRRGYWYGGWHFAVHIRDRGKEQFELFRTLEEALKSAKFLLHNRESVTVLDMQKASFDAFVLYSSQCKRRLVKEPEST